MSPQRPCARGSSWRLSALLDDIPWSDRAEVEEHLRCAAPASGSFRVNNPNGRTRIRGEDRQDIRGAALKAARAESADAAGALLRDIRLVFTETRQGTVLDVRVPRKCSRRGYANLRIQLPRALHVSVIADNGRVDVEGIRGSDLPDETDADMDIRVDNGSIENGRCLCRVARETHGRISGRPGHGGAPIKLRTSNGSISIG